MLPPHLAGDPEPDDVPDASSDDEEPVTAADEYKVRRFRSHPSCVPTVTGVAVRDRDVFITLPLCLLV
jgi:hypothetical protein